MPDQPAPEELKVIKIPDILPILPLFNLLVFPKMMFPMEIFGDQAMKLVDEAMAKDRLIGLVMSKKSATWRRGTASTWPLLRPLLS